MSKNCDHIIDYFNGHLSQTEREEFEQHLATCPDCQEELQELQELLGDVALVSEQASPPPEMKKRILDNVFAAEDQTETTTSVTPINKTEPATKAPTQKKAWLTTILAASLLLSLLGNGYLLMQNQDDIAATPDITPPDSIVNLQPSETSANGFAALYQKEEALSVMVHTEELPELSGTEVYQVWLLKDGSPIPAGDFIVDSQGKGYVLYNIDETTVKEWDTIAITLEPQKGNELPEGKVLLSAGL
ncbi:Anti-sigma-K factor rskA [Bacillus sp. THAF10]|uniref:anti-sigma factor n=1 Tax=Bacillus sp. THAF10 TaxID=2587848 RepID=UPI0012696219|nr:anti-sigma factor [Bacillus sp. THAF10]QFT88010.1 Anti-sigma-K factor rskA [Bacillus sp. THAF10]